MQVRDHPLYHLIKARICKKQGDNEGAVKTLQTAMQLPGIRGTHTHTDRYTQTQTNTDRRTHTHAHNTLTARHTHTQTNTQTTRYRPPYNYLRLEEHTHTGSLGQTDKQTSRIKKSGTNRQTDRQM